MKPLPRRIVAAAGPDGKSRVVLDEPMPAAPAGAMGISVLFAGAVSRTSNSAPLAPGFPDFSMSQLTDEIYSMMIATYPPGLGRDDPGMHSTETADHFLVIEGECVLVLEAEDVVLRTGDAGICRGAVHGWRNDSAADCRLVTFVLPAMPLDRP